MPLYEYECSKCGAEFERILPSTAPPPRCPSCGGKKVEKKFSLFGTKSGGRFISSSGSGCSGCKASTCAGCK